MKTILVGSQKGGVGKTTLAVNIAANLPGNVIIVDIDPQHSACDWAEMRKRNGISKMPVAIRSTAALAAPLEKAKRLGADYCVIDSAPASDAAILEASTYADLVLIPTRVSIPDISAIRTTLRLMQGVRARQYVVLNCTTGLFGAVFKIRKARAAVTSFGGVLADVQIGQRTAFVDAMEYGLSVTEHKKGSSAAAEVQSLVAFILAALASGDTLSVGAA